MASAGAARSPSATILSTSSNTLSTWARVGTVATIGLASFGLIGVFSASTGAQSDANEAQAASVVGAATPLAGSSTMPSISSNGSVVAFSNSGGTEFDHAIVVRDRDAASTAVFTAGATPSAAGISGNGCIVAYSVVVDAPAAAEQAGTLVEIRVIDRCGSAAIAVEPKVLASIPGSSTLPQPALSSDGDAIVVSTRSGLMHFRGALGASPVVTEIDGLNAGDVTGAHVDLSSNGATVVFDSTADDVSKVYIWTEADGVALVSTEDGSSTWPSMSGNGALVAYQHNADGASPAVVVVERSSGARRIVAPNATRPTLATDGRSIIYDSVGAVRVARSDSTSPFEESTEKIVSRAVTGLFESVGESVSGATISADGSLAVFDSPPGAELTGDGAFVGAGHVWVRDTAPIFIPPTTTTVAPVTAATTTPTTLAPVVTAATTTTTTRVVRTIPQTTRVTTTTTTTTIPRPATFDPAAFEFAPTIVDAGRRTADIELVNPSAVALTVTSVEIDPASGSDFALDTTTCGGVLPAGSRCVLTISFIPTSTGEATANVVAEFANGTTATSALRGLGADSPLIEVRPGVASNGQVVSVFGYGFPAGATVDFSWHRGLVEREIEVDDLGEFVETFVVLPNIWRGQTEILVEGQDDLFADVTTELLVSDGPDRSSVAVFQSPLGR